jgi:caffeoyl-CoA O-methyltransferase
VKLSRNGPLETVRSPHACVNRFVSLGVIRLMRPVTLPGIEEYAERHTTPDHAFVLALADRTRADFPMPQMMVGPVEARLLQMLVVVLRPHMVLEIGTFTGYSALSMAAVLPPGGRVITCEADERHAAAARRNIAASPWADRVSLEAGPALTTLARLDGPFDFVFIDADKTNLRGYYEAALAKLAGGGLIAVDNTLWNGDVLDSATSDRETRDIAGFNAFVAADPRVVCVLLTVRDGVTLIRRA